MRCSGEFLITIFDVINLGAEARIFDEELHGFAERGKVGFGLLNVPLPHAIFPDRIEIGAGFGGEFELHNQPVLRLALR